jgi:phage tail protein X
VSGETEIQPLGDGRARIVAPLRLDIIAQQLAGTERKGRTEALLALNPGLASGGPYAAEGMMLTGPERAPPESVIATVNPWE